MSLTAGTGNSCQSRGCASHFGYSAGRVHIIIEVPLAMTGTRPLGEGQLEAGRLCTLVVS